MKCPDARPIKKDGLLGCDLGGKEMAARVEMNMEKVTGRAWLAGLLAWVLPGSGHLFLGRVKRGLVLGGMVYCLFISGLILGGHLYGLHNVADAGLLAYVFGLCDLGGGLLYLASLWGGIGLIDQASRATAEYGNIFLMVAGLLNFLLTLDAFDLGAGRKA